MDSDAAWDGITALYADATLARELLRRQDAEGLDVTLHLFGLWVGTQGIQLDAGALAEADARVGPWRDQVIAPLRALRRRLKSLAVNAPERRCVDALCADLQAAELTAERAQVEMLCEWLRAR